MPIKSDWTPNSNPKKLLARDRQVVREYLKQRDGNHCHYCRVELAWVHSPEARHTHNTATIEHVISRHDGGSNRPDNLVLACYRCNIKKSITPYHLFIGMLRKERA